LKIEPKKNGLGINFTKQHLKQPKKDYEAVDIESKSP
jgi:hypothetical protein